MSYEGRGHCDTRLYDNLRRARKGIVGVEAKKGNKTLQEGMSLLSLPTSLLCMSSRNNRLRRGNKYCITVGETLGESSLYASSCWQW